MKSIVLKFGGISIQDRDGIKNVIKIIKQYENQKIILVFSALGKTTRCLLDCCHQAKDGNHAFVAAELDRIFKYHFELLTDQSGQFAELIKNYKSLLEARLNGVADLNELTAHSLDNILSYGELMSTAVLCDVLQDKGIEAILTDARKMIITDAAFTNARPLTVETRQQLQTGLEPLLQENKIPVVQGFIGSTLDEQTTTLGFEGSDFTAALIANALNCSRVEIWKNVPGIMTADPAVCTKAKVIKILSYDQAAILCEMGAKVLHPATLKPVRDGGIPLMVRDTANPDSMGTTICQEAESSENKLLSITYRPDVSLLRLKLADNLPPGQAMQEIYTWFAQTARQPFYLGMENNYLLAATAIPARELPHCRPLDRIGEIDSLEEIVTVSLVGYQLHNAIFLRELFELIPEIKIKFILRGFASESLTLGLVQSDLKPVLNKLHNHFITINEDSA